MTGVESPDVDSFQLRANGGRKAVLNTCRPCTQTTVILQGCCARVGRLYFVRVLDGDLIVGTGCEAGTIDYDLW